VKKITGLVLANEQQYFFRVWFDKKRPSEQKNDRIRTAQDMV